MLIFGENHRRIRIFKMDLDLRTKAKLSTKFCKNLFSSLEDYSGTDGQWTDRQTAHPNHLKPRNTSRNLYTMEILVNSY